MSILLSEYEQGPINSRVFRLEAEFFKNYQLACNFAENKVLLNE